MEQVRMRIQDVPEDAVLAQDVLWQRRRLVAKGTLLTPRTLDLLNRRNVQYVYIEQGVQQTYLKAGVSATGDSPEETVLQRQDLSKELDILSSIVIQGDTSPATLVVPETPQMCYRNQYLHALAELNTEVRYGRVLADHTEVEVVCDLFSSIMEQGAYRHYLQQLDNKDHYTYLHAIDVFTLSVLFMRKLGMDEYERLGVGFLLHDVGKLKTPLHILKKQGRLTKPEFELMKRHVIDGHELLTEVNAGHVAYLALSHHERADGNGYPQRLKLMQLPREVRVLQLMDMYSAITLPRVYRKAKSVTETISLLFQEKHVLDEEMLQQFVDFIGIYPEHSFVLLSDGSHATVEQVNEQYPLLPAVRIFHTGEKVSLPLDFQLTIQKLLTYHVETPDELFCKFSDYLINSDEGEMERYYAKLKEHYKAFEWFTHLYIPSYQIFCILQQQNVLPEVSIARGNKQLKILLEQTIKQLRQIHQQTDYALIVVDTETVHENAVLLLEGMLHTEGVYSIVMPYSQSEQDIAKHLAHGGFSKVIVLGEKDLPIIGVDTQMELYQLQGDSLKQLLFHLASVRPMQLQVLKELHKYKMVQALIKQI